MSRPAPVDVDLLAKACARGLASDVAIEHLRRLSGGASRETWAFDVVHADGGREALVLRRDPSSQRLGSSDRSTEYALLGAAAAADVPVPAVRFRLVPDDGLGDGFVMALVEGETIPRKILRDDAFAAARPRLAEQCGTIAARIHAVDLDTLPSELAVEPAGDQIGHQRDLVDGFGEAHPAFELALRWLADEMPASVAAADVRLVHGDFRNGNFIVGDDGIRAVLDWELAHLGDPIEDLGWLCVKSWRFGNPARVGGFGDVETLLGAYTAAGGEPVDPDRLRYWEVLGTLKWGVICQAQAFTHLQGFVRSVELAALGRRVAETEWDLLELIAPASGPAPMSSPGQVEPAGTLHDRPTAAELAAAVREYLERDVMPGTEGRLSFHARVAANVLGMVERELTEGPALDAAEHAGLVALLDRDGTVPELTRALAGGIRDGSLDARREAVVEHVRASVGRKLAIANPTYAETHP